MERRSPLTDLPCRAPEEVGVPSAALTALVDALDAHDEIHSLMVLRRGAVVAQGWWDPYRPDLPHDLYSLSKTFTAIALGFARAEGLLSFDDPVVSFFPEAVPAEPSPHLAAMRVSHLLTMRTGHHEDTSGRVFDTEDWVATFLSLPVEHEPGSWFVYNTAATYVLSAIVTRLTGQRLLDYLRPRLLDPLGVEDATWEQCPRGIDTGGFGLALRTRDIAALGLLLVNDGVLGGTQVLPEGWVAEAASAGGPSTGEGGGGPAEWEQGYGYQVWRCRHGAFRGDGAFGQFCIVVPDQDLVVATTAGDQDMQGVMDRVWELLPHLSDAPLPLDPEAHATLAARLAGLRHAVPAADEGEGVPSLVGRDLGVAEHDGLLTGLRVEPGADVDEVHVRTTLGDVRLRAGHRAWTEQTVLLPTEHGGPPQERLLLASADRPEPGAYRVTVRAVTTPFRWTLTLREGPDGTATVEGEQNVRWGARSSGRLVLRDA